jgi:hypothetical protein
MILVLPAYQQPSNIHAAPRPPLELSLITLKIHHKTTYRYRQPVSRIHPLCTPGKGLDLF